MMMKCIVTNCPLKKLNFSSINLHYSFSFHLGMDEEKNNAVTVIWNYMLLGHKMKKADVILCLGSHDLRVATRYN